MVVWSVLFTIVAKKLLKLVAILVGFSSFFQEQVVQKSIVVGLPTALILFF